jgi:hypothetical protein
MRRRDVGAHRVRRTPPIVLQMTAPPRGERVGRVR